MRELELAPGVSPEDKVILYDGVCKLCGAWARFLIRFDRKRHFKLASVQSPEGQAVLRWYGLSTNDFDTMLVVEGSRLFVKSTAFVRVVARLPFPWFLLAAAWLVPFPIRHWFYDRIALNRYAMFGRHDACVVPDADHHSRFLHAP